MTRAMRLTGPFRRPTSNGCHRMVRSHREDYPGFYIAATIFERDPIRGRKKWRKRPFPHQCPLP